MISYLDPKFSHLQKEYDQAVQCNRCGFCETVCPTYVASGKETLSPRGRNQAFRQILEGKILNPAEAEEIFSTCLTCHACTNVCFSEVPVVKLMASAKNVVSLAYPLRGRLLKMSRFLLAKRNLLSVFIWVAFLSKKIGISLFLKKIGLLKKISPELNAAEELIESVPLRFGANSPPIPLYKEGWRQGRGVSREKPGGVVYFSGCGIHYLYPKAAQSSLEILKSSREEIICPNTACCGLISNSMGDIQAAKKLAEKNIKKLEGLKAQAIVVDDDSCCGFMKSYGELLEGDLKAIAFSHKVKNLSEFLLNVRSLQSLVLSQVRISDKGQRRKEKGLPIKATYHDACQMGNAHKGWDAPREILKSFPGAKFVEMEESNWCCGGAGAYCLKNPDLADEILERKLENIKKSEAEIVVTQAASCLLHIGHGIRKKGWKNIQVMHLAEFIYRRAQSYPDEPLP